MEPLTVASIIATLFFQETIKGGGRSLGQFTFEKTSKLVESIKNIVRQKLQKQNVGGILTMAENDPNEGNVATFENVLLSQIEQDPDFANAIQNLIERMKKEGVIKEKSTSQSTHIENKILDLSNSSSNQMGDISIGNVNQGSNTN